VSFLTSSHGHAHLASAKSTVGSAVVFTIFNLPLQAAGDLGHYLSCLSKQQVNLDITHRASPSRKLTCSLLTLPPQASG
jgi:hypothetical protein